MSAGLREAQLNEVPTPGRILTSAKGRTILGLSSFEDTLFWIGPKKHEKGSNHFVVSPIFRHPFGPLAELHRFGQQQAAV